MKKSDKKCVTTAQNCKKETEKIFEQIWEEFQSSCQLFHYYFA
jgi:hypothetical protein